MAGQEFNRRSFLKVGAALVGGIALDAAFPASSKAETQSDWNPITVKQGDTLWSICQYYGISGRQNKVADVNRIIPRLIYPGQSLSLPVPEITIEKPFDEFVWIENEQIRGIPITSDRKTFETDGQKMLIYEGKDFPYILSGHSSARDSDQFPFHPLLRKLLRNREEKLVFWLKRTGTTGWIKAVTAGNLLGHTSEYKDITQANSLNLILRTCATETSDEEDVLYCLARINYNSTGPKI